MQNQGQSNGNFCHNIPSDNNDGNYDGNNDGDNSLSTSQQQSRSDPLPNGSIPLGTTAESEIVVMNDEVSEQRAELIAFDRLVHDARARHGPLLWRSDSVTDQAFSEAYDGSSSSISRSLRYSMDRNQPSSSSVQRNGVNPTTVIPFPELTLLTANGERLHQLQDSNSRQDSVS